jgi:3-oxoacyl-[acyl-carrier-protein] synthase-3
VNAQTPYRSRIESVGLELPERRRSTRELLEACRPPLAIDLERTAGIRETRVCGPGEDSYTLGVDAAWDCLSRSRHRPEDLEVVISTSITTYLGGLVHAIEPCFAFRIKEALGASAALHFDVRNACAGMLTGIYLLDDLIRRGAVRRGMVVAGEYISSIADNAAREIRSPRSPWVASLTVGDAGAAVILERNGGTSPGIGACELATYARHADLCTAVPYAGGPGAMMATDAGRLHRVAIESSLPTLERALAESSLSIDEIDWVIPHQTSSRAIRAGAKVVFPALGGSPKRIVDNLAAYGNTASTSHFVALHRYLAEGRFRPGERILLLAFASGVCCGSLIFTMDELCQGPWAH